MARQKGAKKAQNKSSQRGSANGRNGGNTGMSGRKSIGIANSSRFETKAPKVTRGATTHRIRHTEQIATIAGATSFTATKYELNPGLASTFPWLSVQSAGWEQYRFHSVHFHYRPACATTKIGVVLMANDYDARDPAPSTELAMMSYQGASSDSSWSPNGVRLATASMFPAGPRKYVRDQMISGTDIKTYDAGSFFLAVVGQDNTDTIGRLFVEYDVEFFVPQTSSSVAVPSNVSLWNLGASQVMTTATATTILFDEEVVDVLGITLGSGVFTLPKGAFLVEANGSFTDNTSEVFQVELVLEKDGAALSTPSTAYNKSGATASPILFAAINGYVVSDGTSTVRVRATLTGAAGTLSACGDCCRVVFRCV
nr:capsid protein [Mute swan feces associated narna-like virus 5]